MPVTCAVILGYVIVYTIPSDCNGDMPGLV